LTLKNKDWVIGVLTQMDLVSKSRITQFSTNYGREKY